MSIEDKLDEAAEGVNRSRGLAELHRQHRTTKELRALVRELSQDVEELERQLVVAVGTSDAQPIRLAKPAFQNSHRVVPVVLWSDWHIEENVRPEQTGGRNEYDLEIARARFERLLVNTCWIINRAAETSSVEDIVLWLGGDFMTGHIHDDLVEMTELSPTEVAYELVAWLKAALLEVASETGCRVNVVTCIGNHGRITHGRPRIATGTKHNLEQLVYRLIERDLAGDDRFVFDTSDTLVKTADLGGYVVRFNHGDGVIYNGGIGGPSVPMNRQVGRWNQESVAHLTCVGHFHTKFDGETFLMNGSLIGASEYSRRFGWQPAQQVMTLIDLDRGMKADTYPIFVD